jgi:ribose 5-phosphate isomerase RpiB
VRIAVVSEISARDKNTLILEALQGLGAEVHNIGMNPEGGGPELTYIHTGLMAGLALGTGAADFAVGGCGTGQGFLLSAMQYPGVICGHITEPLDAWLFSQINGGNCVSLALNKGFGWAGELNLRYIFEKLFCDPAGRGYPAHRSVSQRESRQTLLKINSLTHRSFAEILPSLDQDIRAAAFSHEPFTAFIRAYAREGDVKKLILGEAV